MTSDTEKRVLMKGLRDEGLSGEVECPQWIMAYDVFKEKTGAPPQAFIDIILKLIEGLLTPEMIQNLIKKLISGKTAKPKPGPNGPPNPTPPNV